MIGVLYTRRMPIRATAATLALLCLLAGASARAAAGEAGVGPTLPAGAFRIAAAGGAAVVDRGWTHAAEASVRAGLPHGLELAGPLALGIALHDSGDGSGVALGAGVVDAWITAAGGALWSPAAALYGQVRTATSASLRAAFDLTGVEEIGGGGEHPAWIRGAAALLIDVGPYVTVAAGVSYQRRLLGEEAVAAARPLGWAGEARVSLGAVRTQPFDELPTLAIHCGRVVDVIAIMRVDVDMDRRTTDARYLLGLRLDLSTRRQGTR
jgi:hypothetical protein